jgi:hypothetical protein
VLGLGTTVCAIILLINRNRFFLTVSQNSKSKENWILPSGPKSTEVHFCTWSISIYCDAPRISLRCRRQWLVGEPV